VRIVTVFLTGAFCLAGALWFGLGRLGIQTVVKATA
jgi:hypothetical protein